MTAYRRHFSSKHKESPDLGEFRPYRHENQPTNHELAATIGNLSNNIPSDHPFQSDLVGVPEHPQLASPVPTLDSDFPQSLETVDINMLNLPEHREDLPAGTTPLDTNSPGRQHPSLNPTLPPIDWSQYNKIVDADGVVRYVHRTAGRVLRKEVTSWERLLAERKKAHPDAPWYPFKTEAEWKLGYWLATCKSSQSKIDEFLDMEGILAEKPSFGRAYNLFDTIENHLAGLGGPKWYCQQILAENFPDGKHEDIVLYLRDLEECLDCLAGRPDLDGEIIFAPEIIFAGDDEIQVFNQLPTGHLWHKILAEAGQDPDAALGGVLFGSDKTHLTNYAGDVKVHALYVSLGNINKEIRAQTSKRAWMLLAYIPICKWENTIEKTDPKSKAHREALPGILSRRLFHFCMEIICQPLRELNVHEIIDPKGNIRLIFYVLIAYLADLKEQYMIAALDKSNCIHCTATTHDFGSPNPCPVRTSESILEAIARVQDERHPNADPYQFALGAGKERLGDVEYPFWVGLPFVDICQSLSVDLLHGFHKFFFDHPFQWNVTSLGESEIDARMKAQVPYAGCRVFPKGVTHISQMSGKEHRALETVHLSVVANSDAKYSHELTHATRALLDYIYYAQLPSQTEHTLEAFEAAYNEFHRYKDVWIKNGSRKGKTGVIEHFNIPKLHTAGHMSEQIRLKGTADNFSTETIEHLHMDTIKEAYPATNKKEWEKQTIRWLIRREKLLEFTLFQTWRKTLVLQGDVGIEMTVLGRGNGDNTGVGGSDEIRDKDTEAEVSQRKRGGFMPATVGTPEPCPLTPTPIVAPVKKRKRQIDDPDDKEEHSAKRVELAQQTYSLSEHQDVALRPCETLTIAAAQEKYGLPTLLEDCRATNRFPTSIGLETMVGVWKSIRLREPQRRFFPKPDWSRAYASPPSNNEPAVADPVLYLKEGACPADRSVIRLQDCDIGRLRLVFCIVPTIQQPIESTPVFAYLHKFRSLPPSPENATNMFVISKPARLRAQIVEASKILRLCPLAPHISHSAIPGVTPQTTLDKYNTFYINKYRSISDFVFLNRL
ncbi:hypothetical protein FS749_003000 [Ceratobasidium sp. UAMH 11750]|nr:hypothetical protein FS749_003000 [Ceratobasidium sp. UAMH 11750]